ncbi:MAG: hypothetical protein LBL26_09675 [Peptococcaceae bacterium]|jgi:hypothetical protein|nr:hypothetical protein [Peptococcaceae bacterium]
MRDYGVVYEEQGGRTVNRYQWQLFFPILLAVVAFTLVSGAGLSPAVLGARLLLYGVAAGAYLFAIRRQNRTQTSLYRLTKEGVYVRQLDRANRVDIEYQIEYSAILWAGAYADQTSLRRVREWYAMRGAVGPGSGAAAPGPGIRSTRGWQGIGIVFEEQGEMMTRHLEVSTVFFQYLERQLNLVRHII